MLYTIELFNVYIYIFAKSENEKEIVDTWMHWFENNPESGRVSVVLTFVEHHKLNYVYKWRYCNKLSFRDNARAFFGFRKQIREIKRKR